MIKLRNLLRRHRCGIDQINIGANANLSRSGVGTATLKASRNVLLNNGSNVATAAGDLTVEANQQSTGDVFIEVDLNFMSLRSRSATYGRTGILRVFLVFVA